MAKESLKLVQPLFQLDDLLLKTWMLTLLSEDIPWLLHEVPTAIPFHTALTASSWKEKYNKTLKDAEVYQMFVVICFVSDLCSFSCELGKLAKAL